MSLQRLFNMEFRRATALDAPQIARIEELVFPDPWSERDITDLISTEGAMCFVATDGGRVAAYVTGRLIAPEGEIYRVAVLPEYRRRGDLLFAFAFVLRRFRQIGNPKRSD